MLLKDCPVGSEVRCVKWGSSYDVPCEIQGELTVLERANGEKYFVAKDKMEWDEYECKNDDYEIVSQPNTPNNHVRQITLDGVTYKLTPITERKTIEIGGVIYEMETV